MYRVCTRCTRLRDHPRVSPSPPADESAWRNQPTRNALGLIGWKDCCCHGGVGHTCVGDMTGFQGKVLTLERRRRLCWQLWQIVLINASKAMTTSHRSSSKYKQESRAPGCGLGSPRVCWHRRLGIKFRLGVFSPGVHAPALIISGHRWTASANLCAAYHPLHLETAWYGAGRHTFRSTNLLRLKVFV